MFKSLKELMKQKKNESRNVLSLIGNAKSFDDGKVFRSKSTKNTIKTNFLSELNDFEVVKKKQRQSCIWI